jgi:two-component system CheB/CheR fusion protein
MLIYMEPELQRQVLPILHYSLNDHGFLMLGTSEGIGNFDDLFDVVDKKQRIYRKTTDGGYKHLDQLGLPLSSGVEQKWRKSHREHGFEPQRQQTREKVPVTKLLKGLVSGMAPGVVVNAEEEIQYFIGDTQPYIKPPVGEASYKITEVVREPLGFRIASGLQESRKNRKPIELNDLTIEYDEDFLVADVQVRPLADLDGYFVVTFNEKSSQMTEKDIRQEKGTEPPSAAQSKIKHLEEKLSATRQELQATIEELETSNEELKAANEELKANNEELQSTNEELESSKEELQSTNEEIETTILELHRKNRELKKADDDIKNLFKSADIGTLFLSKDLKIKRFTAMAQKIFNMIENDVGRPISHITHKLKYEDLESDVKDVLEHLNKKELEVETKSGEWLTLRVHPYRTGEDVIDGVLITVTDTTEVKKVEQKAQQMRRALGNIVDMVKQPMAVLDQEHILRFANDSFFDRFDISAKSGQDKKFSELLKGRWNITALKENLDQLLSGEQKGDIEFPASEKEDEGEILLGRCIAWEEDRPKLILLTFSKDT